MNSPKEGEEEEEEKDFLVRYFHNAFSPVVRHETLEDERYIVIKFTIVEILRVFFDDHILCVRATLHICMMTSSGMGQPKNSICYF